MLIDLHSHTTISDGLDSPQVIIDKAKATGIKVLAITDHDSTSGWQTLKNSSSGGDLTIVPGAEISCRTAEGISVHILGYLFDPTDTSLNEFMAKTQEDRIPRIKKIILRLNEGGIAITFEDVLRHAKSAATVGRPHLADALIESNVVASRAEAFDTYLHNDSPFYVGYNAPTPLQAITAIKEAGGVSVLAHGLAGSRGETLPVQDIHLLIEKGLDGLEVDHRDHTSDARDELRKISQDFGIFATGSSDYHGNVGAQKLAMEVTAPEVWEGILAGGKGSEVFTL